jgi:hypothetical protein
MNIHIHIERLILDGLPITRYEGTLVQASVETELTRLLIENGLATELRAGSRIPSVHANTIQLTSDNNPAPMGAQIAQAVYSEIGNTR